MCNAIVTDPPAVLASHLMMLFFVATAFRLGSPATNFCYDNVRLRRSSQCVSISFCQLQYILSVSTVWDRDFVYSVLMPRCGVFALC